MKRKIGLFVALVAASTGLVAPTVEAGRPTFNTCTWVASGQNLEVAGQIDGIRWVTIDQAASPVQVTYTDNSVTIVYEGLWNQTSRTTGTYSVVGTISDKTIQSVIWFIYSTRGKNIAQITCSIRPG